MNRAVYVYLARTYGRSPLLWLGVVGEAIRTTIQRGLIVVIMSWTTVAIVSGNFNDTVFGVLLLVGTWCGAALIGTLAELAAIVASDKKYEALLIEYHSRLTNKDMAFYRSHSSGYLTGLLRQHLDGVMGLLRFLRLDVLRMVITLVWPVIILAFFDWRLMGIMLLFIVSQVGYSFWASTKATLYRGETQKIYRNLTNTVADQLTNMVAYKSGGQTVAAQKQVKKLAAEEKYYFRKRHMLMTYLELPRVILTGLFIGAVMITIYFVAGSVPTAAGLIVLTLTFLLQVSRNVADVPELLMRHGDRIQSIYPTLSYLGADDETVLDPDESESLHNIAGKIELRNVSFSYGDSQKPVIEKVSLHIEPGEHVGVVGASGAGKSTLASLIMRFDDVTAGEVLIDDVNIKNLRQQDLRKHIGYVPQETMLFNTTIWHNIRYFAPRATRSQVIAAAKAAHAHPFIQTLEQQYETEVGERGAQLSGGQKQRIILARTILKDASILILDEATSALDSESEKIIQEALPPIIDGRTAIIIAHRLSTVAELDRIIVLDKGKIVEQGTHQDLIKQKGRYYQLWQKQIVAN